MAGGPVYERLVPAPDREFVILVVEQGLGDFVGTFMGRDLIGCPRQQRFSDALQSVKIPGDVAPPVQVPTPEGPSASSIKHGVEWWNLLDPHEGGLEHTPTAYEAEVVFLRTRRELLKRPPAERR